ncbi:MAG: 23S rRNA (adenine(2503)-C(2))-methyltransferase RlmN [Planctomycetota bacterium]
MKAPRLSDLDAAGLAEVVKEAGEPAFRAKQLRAWMWQRGVFDPREMTDLPARLRDALIDRFPAAPLRIREVAGADDGTAKILFTLSDDRLVESVIIPAEKRTTICLSSQVGCGVGCLFCASGLEGLKRNLSRGEILEQYLLSRNAARERDREPTNLVMMGMGEPMHNYEAVFEALGVINSPDGPHLGARRITVSTSGVRKGVERFTEAKTQYTLAFSLHAPNDEIRRELVPLANAMSVDEIAEAAARYLDHTGREVTFEYVLLDGVNDAPEHADELVRRFGRVRGLFNIIPWNPVDAVPFRRPSDHRIDAFVGRLERGGLKVSERRRKGSDIAAACGQLALKKGREA